jgi:tetratricopeptide (TPR) repeat protein
LLRDVCAVGILVQVSRAEYRFSHALIRTTLCEELNSAESGELHLRIGEALEEIHKDDIRSHAGELAHHFREGGELNKATDYFISAGEAALAVFAYEDTAAHWRAALELMPDTAENRLRRANLMDRLCDLPALDVAEGAQRIALLERTLELYQELAQPQAAGHIHLRLAFWKSVHSDADASHVSEHAMKARDFLNQEPAPLSSILSYLGLGVDAVRQMRFDEALNATQHLTELCERSGNEFFNERAGGTHAAALGYLGRLGASFEIFDKNWLEAGRLNDPIGTWVDTVTASHQMLMLGDPVQAAAWVNRELSKPWLTQTSFVKKSLLEQLGLAHALMGNLALAEEFVTEAPSRPLFGGSSLNEHLAFYKGDWSGAELLLERSMNDETYAHVPLQYCAHALLAARLLRVQGRAPEARGIMEKSLAIRPAGPGALLEMALRKELALDCIDCGQLADAQTQLEQCREILQGGEDWRGLMGTLARAEGALASAQGRIGEADDRFAKSVEICRRYQVPFEEAETLHYWGRTRLAAGDGIIALAKLNAAAELYRLHGAGERWLQRVEADILRVKDSGATATGEVAQPDADRAITKTNVFRKEGEYWTLGWAGSETRLKGRRGFDYIASLLRHPGEEIAAWELIAKVEPPMLPIAGSRRDTKEKVVVAGGLGDAGEVLDLKARAQYKQRFKELREEIDLAEQLNDSARAHAARAEIEFIEDEITAAIGLGGRARKNASHTERARLAVTKTVKAALASIRDANPDLGRHLTSSIRTGNFCAYLPKQRVTWLV